MPRPGQVLGLVGTNGIGQQHSSAALRPQISTIPYCIAHRMLMQST